MSYFTTDNRAFSTFEAAREHCRANPKVGMSRTPSDQRYAKRTPTAAPAAQPTSTVAALIERVAKLEAQVASLTAKPAAKRRASIKVPKGSGDTTEVINGTPVTFVSVSGLR